MTDMDGLYLFALVANLFAAAAILGLVPWLFDRRKDETFLLSPESLRWSGGQMRLAEIRKVRLYEKPDGDIRQMCIAGRKQRLSFPRSMEEYKPLADWLRARLPEGRFDVVRLG